MSSQTLVKNVKTGQRKRRWILPVVVIAVLLALSAGGFTYWQNQNQVQPAAATEADTLQTARVRQGNLTLSALGSGTLAAGETASLGFPIEGKVASVNVVVGDAVKEGQVLAELEDLTELENSVTTARLDLESKQTTLDELQSNAGAELANAQLAVVEAKKTLVDAKSGLLTSGMARCDQETIDAYYSKYMLAEQDLEKLGDGGGNQDYYLTTLVPAKNRVAQTYAAYEACAGYTEYEIDSSQTTLTLSEIELKQAQAKLDTLLENNGIDPDELAEAQNAVANAQIALEKAEKKLARGTLTAPFDGTILAVNGKVGDEVDTSAFLTVVDLYHPVIDFSIDETDIDKVSVGSSATIVFDALPDDVFTGAVTQIDPALSSTSGYSVAQGIITMELEAGDTARFLTGMNATVEIIAGEAENAVLVPVEALRDLGDGTYSVFVIGDDGQARLTMVEIGLMDDTYAEVKSGLQPGQVVSTGNLETGE